MSQYVKGTQPSRGTVVSVHASRMKGAFVIASTRYITKGRSAGKIEFKMAPMVPNEKYAGAKVIGTHLFGPPSLTYTPEQIATALGTRDDKVTSNASIKQKRTIARQCDLADMGVEPYDTITVRGRDCPSWTATVVKINRQTGKVAIDRPQHAVRASENRADMQDIIGELTGRGRGRVNKYRWLHTSVISRVERDGQEIWKATT